MKKGRKSKKRNETSPSPLGEVRWGSRQTRHELSTERRGHGGSLGVTFLPVSGEGEDGVFPVLNLFISSSTSW